MITQTTAASTFHPSLPSHLHIETELCPSCGQEIPPEKLEEISGKIAAREREQALAVSAKLEQQYELEKAEAHAKAKADLELLQSQSAAREALALEEARLAAAILIAEKLAEADRASQEMAAEWQKHFEEAEATRKAAEEAGESLQAQVLQLRRDSLAALEDARVEASAREVEVRAEAKQAAESELAGRIAAIETARVKSEATLQARISEVELRRVAAEEAEAGLLLKLDELRQAREAEITKLREQAAAEATRIRQEATEAAEAILRGELAAREVLAEANAKVLEAESKLLASTDQYAAAMAENLNQREVMEKAKDDAVNAEKAKAFEETQKLSNKVNDLQRALEKKTNEELGEGAEVDVFEALREHFPDDRITRIKKGSPGADVLHVVILRGQECGTIIYDSKNHMKFRDDHVTKLRADQLAAKAEHAILSTHKFPKGTGQLHIQDGVVLANPARVVLIATLVRQHLLQVHTLRLSGIERESKTAALYEFITSERCTQLLERVDERAEELLDQQNKEIRWHQNNWRKQGEAIRAIQKAKAELENEIDGLRGIAATDNVIAEAS